MQYQKKTIQNLIQVVKHYFCRVHTKYIYPVLLERKPVSVKKSSGHCGLRNLGNTCFMNSALQCLSNVEMLTNYFLLNHSYEKRCLALEYQNFTKHIWTKEKQEPYSPLNIKRLISQVAPRFASCNQQDAQEFMTLLLSELHEDLLKNYGKHQQKTIISELFHGEIDAVTTCLECKNTKRTPNLITFIPVPLIKTKRSFTIYYYKNGFKQSKTDLSVFATGKVEDLIIAFCNEKKLGNMFQYIEVCSTNKPQVEFTADTLLNNILEHELNFTESHTFKNRQPPRNEKSTLTLYDCLCEFSILQFLEDEWYCNIHCRKPTYAAKKMNLTVLPSIVIIQLKRFDDEYAQGKKLTTLVEFPLDNLDLSPFIVNQQDEKITNQLLYDLVAISNHTGSLTGGHYTTTARKMGTNEWFNFNDESVSRCYNNIVTASAYLLIYVKR